jgi:hypothetical protein
LRPIEGTDQHGTITNLASIDPNPPAACLASDITCASSYDDFRVRQRTVS